VKKGELLARLDSDRLIARRNEQQAGMAEAKANLKLARITLDRLSDIVDQGGVSLQALDEAREAWNASEARLNLVSRQIESTEVELVKSELRAPFDGVITSRNADEGEVVQAGVLRDRIEKNGFWLPLAALTEGSRGLWSVYVTRQLHWVSAGGPEATHEVVRRTVDVIHQEVGRVYVIGTFATDDRVVASGLHRLVPGQWVREQALEPEIDSRLSANKEG